MRKMLSAEYDEIGTEDGSVDDFSLHLDWVITTADRVTSFSSQLSGTLFAVTKVRHPHLGKFVEPSVVLRATRKSPKARSDVARKFVGQLVRSAVPTCNP